MDVVRKEIPCRIDLNNQYFPISAMIFMTNNAIMTHYPPHNQKEMEVSMHQHPLSHRLAPVVQ